jgi:RNA polymerase sigma factor (sigma-70 family)
MEDSERILIEQELVLANRGFVYSMANKYVSSGVPFGDLVNAGMLGLVKASKKYDTSRESKFISFATSWVQHEMIKVIRETRFPCRVPLNLNKTINQIRRGDGDEDSPEFAAVLPLLRTPVAEGHFNSFITHEEAIIDRISISQALETLDLRTKQMLILFAGLGCGALGIPDIAKRFKLSKQRVRSLICAGLVQMRASLE